MTAHAADLMLLGFLAAALWAVLTRDLLKSAIGLAVVSVALALLLFRMGEPLAAVFELSVCAGLITVVFISTISLTAPAVAQDVEKRLNRWKRYFLLPVVLAAAVWLIGTWTFPPMPSAGVPGTEDVRQVLWFVRRLDLVGQVLAMFAGIFGVVVLFKSGDDDPGEGGR